MTTERMRLKNEADVPSLSLLVFLDRVENNLARMIALAGGPARLRPHIKTHKLPQIVALQVRLGVTKCKAATIAEAEMAAGAGASEALLAVQMVGPNVARYLALTRAFLRVAFSTLSDDAAALTTLSQAAVTASATIEVLLDLDVGQHRAGLPPGPDAAALCRKITSLPGLRADGLHACDGHLQKRDPAELIAASGAAFAGVAALREKLARDGHPVSRVVCGGTPTFPAHARRANVECSPGTCVLWDAGYATKLTDLDFFHAAVLLTRVISRPATDCLCLDLGHKAVASEMPHPRVVFPDLPDARAGGAVEEWPVAARTCRLRF